MLAVSRLHLALVSGGSITHAATKLNKLLDISNGRHATPHNDIKAFLRATVMPVLSGTELDRRGNSTELRQYLGMLTRDAAFAASIVRANPESTFVQTVLQCIKEDHQRMRFIPKMTSAQASKTIEHLLKVGVRDASVFPVLIARLDYTNLYELARVMLALAGAGMDEVNMLVAVPLYCGDSWAVDVVSSSSQTKVGSSSSESATPTVRSNNVFEAVRVLRALSKSCRSSVERRRAAPAHSLAEIPRDSLDAFRNSLLRFLFENAQVLRGAHWVNIARALMYFPVEHSELRHFHELCPEISREARAAAVKEGHAKGGSSPSPPRGGGGDSPVTCEMLATLAVRHVFDYAEQRLPIPAAVSNNLSPAFPFDLAYTDLVKLLPMLEPQVLSPGGATSVQEARMAAALEHVAANAQHLLLPDILKCLQTLRRQPPSEAASTALERLVAEAGHRLTRSSPRHVLRTVSFKVIAQLAAALSALRVARCDGFVSFVQNGASFFPYTLTVETTLSFLNALANMAPTNKSSSRDAVQTLLARMVAGYQTELQGAPLVSAYPHAVTKILRACVLLDFIPDAALMGQLLGSAQVPLAPTAEVSAAGGALVFGLTRTMGHFLKQARFAAPARVDELWSEGALRAVLPLAVTCTADASAQMRRTGRADAAPYTAVSWRSTLEMMVAFVDPAVAHNTATEVAQRLVDAYPLCADLVAKAAATTLLQLELIGQNCSSADTLRRRIQELPFNSSCCVHYLSSLLVFEYLIYQTATMLATPQGAAVPQDVRERLMALRDAEYSKFLHAPVDAGRTETPMDVVQRIFAFPLASSREATATAAAPVVVLTKRDALEITTNLPFSLSLIMNPGPVNECFTEHCMSLMVSEDDA